MNKYLAFATTALFSFNLNAFDSDSFAQQRLDDRINKIETDLNILQKDYYSQSSNSRKLSRSDMKKYPKVEVRILELEEQIRDLNGKIEEKDFLINNLSSKLDRLIDDVNLRVGKLEKKSASRRKPKTYRNGC